MYKAKHDGLLGGLRELEEDFQIRGEYAGLHVLLTHKKGMAEEKLISLAADRGIRVYGLSDCLIGKPEKQFESTVMLGYASLSESDIQEGTRGLIEAWS